MMPPPLSWWVLGVNKPVTSQLWRGDRVLTCFVYATNKTLFLRSPGVGWVPSPPACVGESGWVPFLPTGTEASVILAPCLEIFPSSRDNMLMICCTGLAFEGKSCHSVITLSQQLAVCQALCQPQGVSCSCRQGYPTPQQRDWHANWWAQSPVPADGVNKGPRGEKAQQKQCVEVGKGSECGREHPGDGRRAVWRQGTEMQNEGL